MAKFLISSCRRGDDSDKPVIKTEVVDSAAIGAAVAIDYYNAANPAREATSAGAVLPGTSDAHLESRYPQYTQGGYYVSPLDEKDR
jgi:hypothetical protein